MRDDYIILFLDDSVERAAVLHQRMPERDVEHVVWVKTVAETLDFLVNYRERLRTVYLDHNLNGMEYQHSGSDTSGMEIVRWLEKQNHKYYEHVKFVVHSWNISAAVKMVERLRDKGYLAYQKPFGMEGK
jgi:plasmid stabilization system protein ParE